MRQETVERKVQWLVFGLVVVLVVTIGSIGLAMLLPGAVADSGYGAGSQGDQAGGPFSTDGGRVVALRGVIAPLWVLLLVAVPLFLVGVVIIGLVWGTRGASPAANLAHLRCGSCGQEMELDWRLCPYCGEARDKENDQ